MRGAAGGRHAAAETRPPLYIEHDVLPTDGHVYITVVQPNMESFSEVRETTAFSE